MDTQKAEVTQLTAMATTKFFARFWNLHMRETPNAERYDTINWTINIKGITPSSTSFSAVSCEANLMKTANIGQLLRCEYGRKSIRT